MAKYTNMNPDGFDITKDELKEIGEALKHEQFRKLLSEYVEEVTDPTNRAIYEKEMTQLEKERGVDITFIHPLPGYVIKSSVDGVQKAFINVCSNDKIEPPEAQKKVHKGVQGNDWSIPHIFSPPKVDLDKKGQRCVVYDVVFHPMSLELAKKNNEFRNLINDIAISGVEDSFNAKIDRNNIKFPKMDFKGPKMASVVRRISKDAPLTNDPPIDIPNYPYSPLKEDAKPKISKPRKNKREGNKQQYTTPKFVLKHRKGVELHEYTNEIDAKVHAAIPSELVLEIDLPLLSSASDAVLDVCQRSLSLISEKPSKYKLQIELPYDVDESSGSAKFDKRTKKLIVALPVVKRSFDLAYLARDDSGIESDPNHNRSSSDEDLSKPIIEVLSSSDKVTENYKSDDKLRTSEEVSGEFLLNSVHYSFPPFSFSSDSSSVKIVIDLKNIDPSSVLHQYVFSGSGVQFKFTSIGSGYFPIHYAFCIQFPDFVIRTSSLKADVRDDNLTIGLELIMEHHSVLSSYLVGSNINTLEEKLLEREISGDHQNKNEKQVNNEEEVSNVCDQLSSINLDTSSISQLSKKSSKVRTASESNAHPPCLGGSIRRSILKTSRSLSESHSEDYNTWSSLDSSDNTEDHNGAVVKKTVRFSDVIRKKVFRANSSILGQKHKNEKKARNRKKTACAKRRASESENSEVSDFSDYSEVSDLSASETSDVSSDDQSYSTFSPPPQLPSGKRHRRRGSKNSRKNAATAKQNFILSHD